MVATRWDSPRMILPKGTASSSAREPTRAGNTSVPNTSYWTLNWGIQKDQEVLHDAVAAESCSVVLAPTELDSFSQYTTTDLVKQIPLSRYQYNLEVLLLCDHLESYQKKRQNALQGGLGPMFI